MFLINSTIYEADFVSEGISDHTLPFSVLFLFLVVFCFSQRYACAIQCK